MRSVHTSVRTVHWLPSPVYTLKSRLYKKSIAFCTISVRARVAQIRVVQENNDTHVLLMILSDPLHLQYHDCQVWVLIVDDHRSWR